MVPSAYVEDRGGITSDATLFFPSFLSGLTDFRFKWRFSGVPRKMPFYRSGCCSCCCSDAYAILGIPTHTHTPCSCGVTEKAVRNFFKLFFFLPPPPTPLFLLPGIKCRSDLRMGGQTRGQKCFSFFFSLQGRVGGSPCGRRENFLLAKRIRQLWETGKGNVGRLFRKA